MILIMRRNMIYKIVTCLIGVTIFIACTNEEQEPINTEMSAGNKVEIRIYTGEIEKKFSRGSDISNLSSDEKIDRLDVFVYNEDGTLFEYMEPKFNGIDGTYVATLEKDVVTDTKKDVFILANYDETKIDELRKKSSSEMQKLVRNSIQKWTGDKFEGHRMLSASALGHNFSNDRVLEINITRIYSKITLQCIYNYSNSDIEPSEGQTPIAPTRVAVSIDSLINIPQDASVFPNLFVNTAPNFENHKFGSSIPLAINGDKITEMNQKGADNPRVYDLSADEPNLMLFPHNTGKNDTTLVCLNFKLYGAIDIPVKEFNRVFKFPDVGYNKNYQIMLYFNQLDKPKTRGVSGREKFIDVLECSYEIIPLSLIEGNK